MIKDKFGLELADEPEMAEETISAHEYGIRRRLVERIADAVYATADVYEAKKKRAAYGTFEWGYYDIKQSTALVIAKGIEHTNIDECDHD